MSWCPSSDPHHYTVGRLAVAACPEYRTGLCWETYAGFNRAGREAGTRRGCYGYFVTVHGKLLCCRRLVWELQNGPLPRGYEVVPIDGNLCNIKIENLTLRQKEIV